jgi:peptide-methionine (S)-S-oxide reductase
MSDDTETAILAGGCFWIMQQLLRDRDGVVSTRVGWTGGQNDNPTEENNVGHAEAVEVVFDPERISYRGLLEFFLQVHRPDLGEQLVGSDYRSESSTRPTSSAGWPRRRSPMSTLPATGRTRP